MSLIDTARDALKDLPISDIVRERLSLALDLLAEKESKIEELQVKLGGTEGQLERERLDHQKTRQELQRLKDEHAEDVRIFHCVEFRRGKRTGGVWVAFCPACHLPAVDFGRNGLITCTGGCTWSGAQVPNSLDFVIRQLGGNDV